MKKKREKLTSLQPAKRAVPEYATTRENIKNFLFGKGNNALSDEEQLVLQRWLFADKIMLQRLIKPTETWRIIQAMKERFPAISERTLYKDIQNAKLVFSINPDDRLHYSRLHYEWALEGYTDAKAAGNFSASAKFLSIMEEIMTGLSPTPEAEKLKELLENRPTTIIVVADPEKVGLKPYTAEEIERMKEELTIELNEDEFTIN
jgi:hypothetical protein